jgi:hypothetical protein
LQPDLVELAVEPAACPVKAHTDRRSAALERGGEVMHGQPVPADQCQEFLVAVAELAGGGGDEIEVIRFNARSHVEAAWQLCLQPSGEPPAPSVASMLGGEHPARDGVQPRAGLVARWDVGQLAPSDQKGLGHDVACSLGVTGPSERVRVDQPRVRLVEVLEQRAGVTHGRVSRDSLVCPLMAPATPLARTWPATAQRYTAPPDGR